jgi:hypothetical protein
MVNYSRMRSGVQGATVQGPSETCASLPSFSPPPCMSEFGENNNSQLVNRISSINNDGIIIGFRVSTLLTDVTRTQEWVKAHGKLKSRSASIMLFEGL